MAGIRVSVVQHHHIPMEWKAGDTIETFGKFIDEQIAVYVKEGLPIQTVAVEFDVNDFAEQNMIQNLYKQHEYEVTTEDYSNKPAKKKW